jgi:7-keto-8-aminopelargonate synthetase-like enzyme
MTELPYSAWSGAAPGSWLARWLSACADLDELFAHHHLLDAIIEEIDGRRIRVGERWLIDFASCNYLGLDLDREVIEAIPAFLDRWGPTRAGRGCWAARPCTGRSRPGSPNCWGRPTRCCCRP